MHSTPAYVWCGTVNQSLYVKHLQHLYVLTTWKLLGRFITGCHCSICLLGSSLQQLYEDKYVQQNSSRKHNYKIAVKNIKLLYCFFFQCCLLPLSTWCRVYHCSFASIKMFCSFWIHQHAQVCSVVWICAQFLLLHLSVQQKFGNWRKNIRIEHAINKTTKCLKYIFLADFK